MKFRLSSLVLAAGLLATSLVSAAAADTAIPADWISLGNFEEIEALLKECPRALVQPLTFPGWDSTALKTICPYGLKPIQVAAANAQTNNRMDIVQFLINHGATLTAEEKTLLLMEIDASLRNMNANIHEMSLRQLNGVFDFEGEIKVVQDRVDNLSTVRQLIAERLPIERVSSAWA